MMMTQPPPSPKEIQEYQFRLLARLRVFKGDQKQLPLKSSLSLVAAAPEFGLICVCSSTGFYVIESSKIIEQYAGVKKPAAEVIDFPRRSIVLDALPTHLDISCDSQHLAVGYTLGINHIIRIYDVTSFMAQNVRLVMEVRLAAPLQALSWNPGIPNLLAACLQDGSAAIYEFKGTSFELCSIPPEALATCLCWSPKGKQIVIGSRNGALNQFKPDLKIVKAIPPPQGDVSIVSVHWLSNLQYAAVYRGQNGSCSLVIVNTPRNQPISYINYEDITYSNGDNRLAQFYFIHQQVWNILLVASANSMEVGVLGLVGEWEQWQLEDFARAELPLSPSKQETHPVGMAFDTSVQYNIPWDENHHFPAMPLLLLLSHEGLLTLYWFVNLLPVDTTICSPPKPLSDTSGLHLFTSPQPELQVPELQTVPSSQASFPQAQASFPQAQASFPQTQEVKSPQTFVTAGPPPQSVVTPMPSLTTQPMAFTVPPVSAPALQGQQPTTISQPTVDPTPTLQAENNPPTSPVQGSWMSNQQSAFIPSVTQSAFSAATPAFNLSTPPPPVFNTSVPPPAFNLSGSAVQVPSLFNFASSQASDMFNKPGAFVSSLPDFTTMPPPLPPTFVSKESPELKPQAAAEVPIPRVPSPVPSVEPLPPTPEPEVSEESQELKAMNDAMLENALMEEIACFEQELKRQKALNLKINVDNIDMSAGVDSLVEFMRELKDTTTAQEGEIVELRNFLLEVFSYVESMKNRIRAQSGAQIDPEYMTIHTPQGLDPILEKKMRDIKKNMVTLESELTVVADRLNSSWSTFQDGNKKNRNAFQTPSLEAIFEAMVLQSSLLMKIKNNVDNLEVETRAYRKKRLMELRNLSQMIEEKELTNESEISKITDSFLFLNFRHKRESKVGDLEQSVSDMNLSGHSFLPQDISLYGGMSSEKLLLLQQLFSSTGMNYVDYPKTLSPLVSSQQTTLQKLTSTPLTGSISSGQPIMQTTLQNKTSPLKETSPTPIVKESRPIAVKEPKKTTGEIKPKSSFGIFANTVTSANGKFTNTRAVTSTLTPTVGNNTVIKNLQFSTQKSQTPNVEISPSVKVETSQTLTSKNSPVVPFIGLKSVPLTPPPVTTQQTAFAGPSTSGFSFSLQATTQTSSVFSVPPNLGSSTVISQVPASTVSQSLAPTFGKPAAFSTIASTSTSASSVFTFSLSKTTESPKSIQSSTVNFSFTNDTPEKTFSVDTSISSTSPPSSPLASLTSLVSGIEPLKPGSESTSSFSKIQESNETSITTKSTPNQPFVFKVTNPSETKVTSEKETGAFIQKPNIFGHTLENKQILKEPTKTIGFEQENSTSDMKNQFSGAFKKLSFDSSPPKSIFGGTPASTQSGTASIKSDQTPKNLFSFPNTSTGFLGNSNVTATSQNQKSIFGGTAPLNLTTNVAEKQEKPAEYVKSEESENVSPIIELYLSPSKNTNDTKTSLEKLNAANALTITKVESPDRKSTPVEKSQSENNSTTASVFSSNPSSVFSSNPSSFTTPTKSTQSIFGGSSPSKPSVMYEVSKPEAQVVSSSADTKTESNAIESDKQVEVSKPQSLFAGASVANTSATTFTFSTATLQSTQPSAENTQSQQNPGFSFGLKTPAITTTSPTTQSVANTQSTSTFSFAQTAQPLTSAFSFAIPASSIETTATNTFGFGNLSTGSSEDKSKMGFSFGQQMQTPATTSTSIFGGFGSKPTEPSSVFGQTTATTGATQSVFGQTPSAETKNIFGNTPTTVENKSVFGQSSTTTADTKPADFSFSLSISSPNAEPSSFFGSPGTTSSSVFGQPICSPTSTASSPFGQPTTTPVFGTAAPSPFGDNTFGSKPAFGQSGGSFFSQSSGGFGSSGGSMFGGGTSGTPSLFGSNAQPTGSFGQPQGVANVFGGGSFSGGGQTVGQTGFGTTAFQNKPPAFGSTPSNPSFGALPAFGGSPTFGGSPAFGSPPKVFGGPPSSTTTGFGGMNPTQSSTFENLANQNTMTFGNLAQNQPTGFGTMFSGAQNTPAPPAFPATTTGSMFGGSSFSSWR